MCGGERWRAVPDASTAAAPWNLLRLAGIRGLGTTYLRNRWGNGKKHAAAGREISVPQAIDTFTSAPWLHGFRERITVLGLEAIVRPVANARTWLLTEGWLRHGRLGVHEAPATA